MKKSRCSMINIKSSYLVALISLSFYSVADEVPVTVALTYDTSRITVNNVAQQANRVLASISYDQSFDFFGGKLSPQATYSVFRGDNGSDIAQDVLGLSNIDAERFSAWQEVNINWQNNSTLIRIGQLDANANFVSLEHAGQFINASFGLTPTAFPLPTYPDMEYGVYAEHKISSTLGFSIAYYRPDEITDNGEQKPLWMGALCLYCNESITVNGGYWRVNHSHAKVISGYFLYVEGNIYPKLHGFTLVSFNNQSQSENIKKHVKLGVTYDAPFRFEDHQVGLAYSKVFGPDNEAVIEAFYLIPLNAYLNLQPDIQWINNNINNNVNNIVATLRVNFEW